MENENMMSQIGGNSTNSKKSKYKLSRDPFFF